MMQQRFIITLLFINSLLFASTTFAIMTSHKHTSGWRKKINHYPVRKTAQEWPKEIHWDWSKINHTWDNLYFPKNFCFGIATSHFQIEGAQGPDNTYIENNWTTSKKINLPTHFNACKHWQYWKKDIQLIKNIHANCYRFSIGWDRIEPQAGVYDYAAINHYKKIVKELKKNGIEPWICLFHFTLPTWAEKRGGFTNDENVHAFISFCKKIFYEFHNDVRYWLTFNEPIAYTVEAYITGKFPPHKKSGVFNNVVGFYKAGKALRNILFAHVEIYHACKQIAPQAQIGLAKMFHIIDPNSKYNPIERFIASQGSKLINDTVLNYFKHGSFNWKNLIIQSDKWAPHSLDFIGVNYYRHQISRINPFKDTHNNGVIDARPDEPTAHDTGWAVYPEGLYRSIKKAGELNLPIYVTEIGIADSKDEQRDGFYRKHLYAIQQALNEGSDVRGCFFWSLMDNYEWGCHPTRGPRFGLYYADLEQNFTRYLRPDVYGLVNYLKRHQDRD